MSNRFCVLESNVISAKESTQSPAVLAFATLGKNLRLFLPQNFPSRLCDWPVVRLAHSHWLGPNLLRWLVVWPTCEQQQQQQEAAEEEMLTHGCCLHVLRVWCFFLVFFSFFLHSNFTALVVVLLLPLLLKSVHRRRFHVLTEKYDNYNRVQDFVRRTAFLRLRIRLCGLDVLRLPRSAFFPWLSCRL